MSSSNYFTIEEVAHKLGRMPSWVKEQICEGKIDATLSGNRWLISFQTFETLQSRPSPTEPNNTVHNFLPDRLPKKRGNAPGHQLAQRHKPAGRSRQSESLAGNRQSKKGRRKGPTLTRQIRKLDQKFNRLTTELKTAMLESQTSTKSGSKSEQVNDRLREWKKVKSELQRLLHKANINGLVLPTNLSIHRVLSQESGTVNRERALDNKRTHAKPPMVVKGIDGYYAGPRHARLQQTPTRPAEVEARLIILRNRERAAAHDMQDRAKSREAREAAGIKWAEARREAEALERDLKNARPRDKSP